MKKLLPLLLCLILIALPLFSGCGSSPTSESQESVSDMTGNNGPDQNDPAETTAVSGKTEVSIHYPEPLPHEGAAQTASNTETDTPTPELTQEVVKPSLPEAEAAAQIPEQNRGEPPIGLIREQTENLINSFDGEWSVYFERLDTGESFTLNDFQMVSASLIKLYVYGAVMEQIENGDLPEGVYDDYLYDMITWSDNDSCNVLIDAAGGFDVINDFIARYGFHATELNRRMLDWNGLENYTSASNCGHLLREALAGTFVSAQASGRLLDLMRQQSVTWKIPAGVPEGIVTGNKTGELTNIENDAAFIESPACTYILCVMTAGVDSGTAIGNINELSSAVYSLLNQDLEGEEP